MKTQDKKTEILPLSFSDLGRIKPGIYESDNIELILSYPLKNLEHNDIVIFDIDDVLITQRLDPFLFEHIEKESLLYKKFLLQEQYVRDQFFLYLFVSQSLSTIMLMDEKIPTLIKKLQTQGIKCLGNTAIDPISGSSFNFDSASARIALLRDFDIDFSSAFYNLSTWDFDTLDQIHITRCAPLFKEGIVFSSRVPKHITQHELFYKLGITPKKLVFIDDRIENVQNMYDFTSSIGIECYSFCYSKNKTKSLLSYFSDEAFKKELKKLEGFVEKLLNGENMNKFYLESYSGKFVLNLNIEPGWTLGHKEKLKEKEHKEYSGLSSNLLSSPVTQMVENNASNNDSNLFWFTLKILAFLGFIGTSTYVLYKVYNQCNDVSTFLSDDTSLIGDDITDNL